MDMQEIVDRLNKLVDEGISLQTMSMDEIAEHLGIEDRVAFKQTIVAAQAPWHEAKTGITCSCGEQAIWLMKKKTLVENGHGFDIFPFLCASCNKVTERKWRAPSLDGQEFEAYVTTYKLKGV